MLSNSVATWMGGESREEENCQNSAVSWNNAVENNVTNINQHNVVVDDSNVVSDVGGLSSFKSMLEVENEWYNNITATNGISFSAAAANAAETADNNNLLLNPIIDSSSSCSPSPSVFNPTNIDPSQISWSFPSKANIFSNPLAQSFNIGNGFFHETGNSQQISDLVGRGNGGVLGGFSDFSPSNDMGSPNFGGNSQFSAAHLVNLGENEGFGARFRGIDEGNLMMNSSLFVNRTSKMLKPLENSAPVGAQPTLFQKRAALRKNFSGGSSPNLLNSGSDSGFVSNNAGGEGENVRLNSGGESDKKRKFGSVGVLDSVSFDGSGFNYDSDDYTETNNSNMKGSADERGKNGGTNSNANSTVTGNGGGDFKGKKKGQPAKNLMAERRRRKKLNDRLYMLRSVVPKISKMDRASILGDAIEYLKELLQKINDLHNELESSPPASSLTQTTNFHPLTPTLPNLPSRIKEELYPSSLPSPNGQPARIEVRLREGRAVNIHMFCGRRPGLLLSTMRALDGLGLDIQQAVISCFNGFAMDIFRAEQCKDGQDVHPEQIKALLLDLASFHGSTALGNCNM